MNESNKIHLYLVDDMVIVHETVSSYTASYIIVNKQYRDSGKLRNTSTDQLNVRLYVKEDSVAILSVYPLETKELLDIFNTVVFNPAQRAKRYNRIIRTKNSKYPVFTDVETDKLIVTDSRERTVKMTFKDSEVISRSIVDGETAFAEMNKFKKEYYATLNR